MPINGSLNREDYPIHDQMLILATYALTDGHLKGRPDSPNKRIVYGMSPNRQGLHEVIAALESLRIPYRKEERVSHYGPIHNITILSEDAQPILEIIDRRRDRIPDLFLKLSQRQCMVVLSCWAKSDGQILHDHPHRMQLQCDNMQIADRLQQIALCAGLGTRITLNRCKSICGEGENTSIYVNTYARDSRRVVSRRVPYKGKIWCPTTDAGVVVFREDNLAPYISGNSVFWNIAYFDQPYFQGMFENFVFPDGTPMRWESVNWLQKRFMKWFNQERLRKLLTFPVETVNLLDDGTDYVDPEWKDFVAEMWAEGHSFFVYRSDSVDS